MQNLASVRREWPRPPPPPRGCKGDCTVGLRPDPTPPTTWVVGSDLRLVVRRLRETEEGAVGRRELVEKGVGGEGYGPDTWVTKQTGDMGDSAVGRSATESRESGEGGVERWVTGRREAGEGRVERLATSSRDIGEREVEEVAGDVRDMGDSAASSSGHALARNVSHG